IDKFFCQGRRERKPWNGPGQIAPMQPGHWRSQVVAEGVYYRPSRRRPGRPPRPSKDWHRSAERNCRMAPWSTRTKPSRIPPPRQAHLRLRPLERRNLPAAGGGFTAGGVLGEYFDNPDLAGEPAFVRRDVRIEFDWQDRAPGGSTSPEFQRVGADDFSVRWT